jgi:hypothetical protein
MKHGWPPAKLHDVISLKTTIAVKIPNLTTRDYTGYTPEWNFKPFEEENNGLEYQVGIFPCCSNRTVH